jgi:hypothetical protein
MKTAEELVLNYPIVAASQPFNLHQPMAPAMRRISIKVHIFILAQRSELFLGHWGVRWLRDSTW